MKERFSTEEWQELRVIPVTVLFLVAGADGEVDQEEAATFLKEVSQGAILKDELHRELAVDIASDVEGVFSTVGGVTGATGYVERTKGVLRSKLSDDEYQRFIASLFISGLKVANASGSGLLGTGNKISDEEKIALGAFSAVWGLDPASISKYFS